MLIAFQTFNNIIAYRLLITHCGVLSDNYRYQITDDFEKPLDLKGVENTKMIITSILFIFHIHIKPTRLLKNSIPNAKFNAGERFRSRSTGLDWDNSSKIEKAIVMDEDAKDKEDL